MALVSYLQVFMAISRSAFPTPYIPQGKTGYNCVASTLLMRSQFFAGAMVLWPLNSAKEMGGIRFRKPSRNFLFSTGRYLEGNSSNLVVIVFKAAIVEVE